jgi:hypothetical protein
MGTSYTANVVGTPELIGPWHHVLIDSGTIKADNMKQPIYHRRVVSKFQANMNKHSTLTFSEQR